MVQGSALAPLPAPGDRRPVEIGLRARVAIAALYLSAQTALILTSQRRPERAFGFQMFSESSTVRFSLLREVEAPSGHGTLAVHAYNGEWEARSADGTLHRFSWRDRVKIPALAAFDTTLEAGYGAAAQIARMQAALDDVAEHTPNDAETERLLADVIVKRNGREPTVVHLASAPRPLP
jgi:hypothetical protein